MALIIINASGASRDYLQLSVEVGWEDLGRERVEVGIM